MKKPAPADGPQDLPKPARQTQCAAAEAAHYERLAAGERPMLAPMTTAPDSAPRPPGRRHRSMEPVLLYIEAHLGEPLRLENLAALSGLSLWRFATVFRERVGMPPYRYVDERRVRHAQALLRQGVPAARVATEAGFYDQSHLSRRFKRLCGMTPGQYQTCAITPT